jgi:hypothetical protein
VLASLAANKPDELEAEVLVDARICAAAGDQRNDAVRRQPDDRFGHASGTDRDAGAALRLTGEQFCFRWRKQNSEALAAA